MHPLPSACGAHLHVMRKRRIGGSQGRAHFLCVGRARLVGFVRKHEERQPAKSRLAQQRLQGCGGMQQAARTVKARAMKCIFGGGLTRGGSARERWR